MDMTKQTRKLPKPGKAEHETLQAIIAAIQAIADEKNAAHGA